MEISQTADNALRVLEAIHRAGEASVSELMTTLQLGRNVTQRLVNTLHHEGLVRRRAAGRFVLGAGIIPLSHDVPHPLVELSASVIRRLAQETEELMLLTEHRAGEMILLAKEDIGQSPLRVEYEEGYRHSVLRGASGHVVLAHLDQPDRSRLLETDNIGDVDLDQIRTDGFAVSSGSVSNYMAGIAAPIQSKYAGLLGALSVVAPTVRGDTLMEHVPTLKQEALLVGASYDEWLLRNFELHGNGVDG